MKVDQMRNLARMRKLLGSGNLPAAERKKLEAIYFTDVNAYFRESEAGPAYQEMEMSSGCVDVHEDISQTKDTVSLHSHSFYEILLCKSGNLQYLVGDTRYQLSPGCVVFLPPGLSHRPLFLDQLTEPYRRIVVWVNAEYYNACHREFLCLEGVSEESLAGPHYVMRPAGSLQRQIEQLFDSLLYEKTQGLPGSEFACAALFPLLACQLYRLFLSEGGSVSKPEKTALLDEILHYIEDHLAEEISLDGIADAFHVSPSTISQLFKKQMDVSFYRVVTQRRLIEAKNLITAGLPIKDVAGLCGFPDYSAFYKAFVKAYGISPRQFLRNCS